MSRLAGVALVLCTCLAGCATEERRLPKATGRCLLVRTISSWSPLDAYRMRVDADTSYVIEFSVPCHPARLGESVHFEAGADGRVCDYRGDRVVFRDQSCSIGSIRPLREIIEERDERELE